jgi:hypothetical protein
MGTVRGASCSCYRVDFLPCGVRIRCAGDSRPGPVVHEVVSIGRLALVSGESSWASSLG